MRLKLARIPHIANKIALDLYNSKLASLKVPLETLAKVAKDILEEDCKKEFHLDQQAQELVEKNQQEVEFLGVDERRLFWMIKKQLAEEEHFLLQWDDRYNALSHTILDIMLDRQYISFNVNKIRIKNIIFKAIDSYSKLNDSIHEEVMQKIKNYKRKILVGTDEYDIIYERLYNEELHKKGFSQ